MESSRTGDPWRLRVPVLATDAAEAVWTDARLYVLSDSRCASGGTGAIVEVVAPGSFRSKASGVCARDAFHARGAAGILWVDREDAGARRLDLATGTVSVLGSNGAFAGAQGAAAWADGSFFVADAVGALRQYDPQGTPVALVSDSAAHPVFSETLYFVEGNELRAGVFDHGIFLGTRLVADVPVAGIRDLAPHPEGGVLALTDTTVLHLDSSGTQTVVGDAASGDEVRIGLTPFGELFRTRDGAVPEAVLP